MKLHIAPRYLLLALAAVPVAYLAMRQTTKADGSSGGGTPAVSSVQMTKHDGVSSDGLVETISIDSLGHTVKTYTDGLGCVRRKVDAEGKTTTYSYDAGGNLLSWRDANGNGEDHVYDALNRCTSITDTAGSTRTFAYSVGGLLLSETDAKGGVTRYAYDAKGRQISVTDPLGGMTRFAFDANSNRTTVTDAEGKSTQYAFDNRNQQISTSFPGHVDGTQFGTAAFDKIQLQFDAAGRLIKLTRQDGSAEVLAYDFFDRLVSRTFLNANGSTESTDSFTYDSGNRVLSTTKGRYGNTVAFTYDTFGRKASESLTVSGQTYTTLFAYNADGQLTSITYPGGKVITRTYTNRKQLASITLGGQTIATFTYDDAGRETQRNFGNGASQTRTYRTDDLPAAFAVSRNGANDTSLAITYGYDQNKNLTQEQFAGVMAPFSVQNTQDAKNRLTAQTQTNGNAQSWNLTLEGDWAQFSGTTDGLPFAQVRTHNDKHQITLLAPALVPQYDTKGNLTSDDQGRALAWDRENKLQAIGGTTFAYDALGRRVSKTSSGITTLYISADNQEIAEYQNGVLAKEHVYGTYVDEAIATVNADGSKHYRVMDRRYSTTALLDDQGNVVERYAYSPYGATQTLNPDGSVKVGAPLTDVLWTGRKLDQEVGNYYFRSRYFSPQMGRFLNRDTAGYVDGWNLYEGYFAEEGLMDWSGENEVIIVGGVNPDPATGIAKLNPFADTHDQNWRNFIDAALQEVEKRMSCIGENENIELVINLDSYINRLVKTKKDKKAYDEFITGLYKMAHERYKDRLVIRLFQDKDDFVDIFNTSPVTLKPRTLNNKIRYFHFFGHGYPGEIWLDYTKPGNKQKTFSVDELKRLSKDSMSPDAECKSDACNGSETRGAKNGTNFSRGWADHFGVPMEGWIGRTTYKDIPKGLPPRADKQGYGPFHFTEDSCRKQECPKK